METITSNSPNQGSLLTASDVAKRLSISCSQAYRMMQNQEIGTVRLGRMVRVKESDLEAFIQSRSIPPAN